MALLTLVGMDASGESAAICAHCRHTQQTHVTKTYWLLRRIRGKPPRAQCGHENELGFRCQCRSRFHATLASTPATRPEPTDSVASASHPAPHFHSPA